VVLAAGDLPLAEPGLGERGAADRAAACRDRRGGGDAAVLNLALEEEGAEFGDERIVAAEAGVVHYLAVPAWAVPARAGGAARALVVADVLAGSADAEGEGGLGHLSRPLTGEVLDDPVIAWKPLAGMSGRLRGNLPWMIWMPGTGLETCR
jgi:hypothetical protein